MPLLPKFVSLAADHNGLPVVSPDDHTEAMAPPTPRSSRQVEVAASRLTGWFERFAASHGTCTADQMDDDVLLTAEDGATARIAVPFPPLHPTDPGSDAGVLVAELAAHVLRPRRIGVLLVRLGGHAAGIVDDGRILTSKVGSRQVHGRSAAGGWSQQRFARRREGQVRVAHAAASEVAVVHLLPDIDRLDAVVVGGDRRAIEAVLADPRLAPLRRLVTPGLLDVPDPRKAVLDAVVPRLGAVRITVVDPPTSARASRRPGRRCP